MEKEAKIKVTKDGPYKVTGNIPLNKEIIQTNKIGEAEKWKKVHNYPRQESYLLCRCGHSKAHPYCDYTHASIDFNGEEQAEKTYIEQAEKIKGPCLDLTDLPHLCAGAGFCYRDKGIWNLTENSDDDKDREMAIQEAFDCPSGRLVVWDKNGNEIEPKLTKSISITEDPKGKVSGPIWVKGKIPIESSEGKKYELRNIVTLCRCGNSKNKPFCDSKHVESSFNDGDESVS